jgi:plasmid maintenance system antidote protein VapI
MRKQYYTITDYARLMEVTRQTVYNWIEGKKVTYEVIGGVTFVVV